MNSKVKAAFAKERAEHLDLQDFEVWTIVRDHFKATGQNALASQAAGQTGYSELAEIKGAEIFMAGTWLGETYSEEDVAEIAANTNKLLAMKKFEPPAKVKKLGKGKLGHSEAQEVAETAGLPAAGWVSRVYLNGCKLLADFKDVPAEMAEWIRKGLYRYVSSEIYGDKLAAQYFGEYGISGKVLRAVAFLGADVPVVKGLAPLPLALHEAATGGYKVAVFSQRDKHIMAHDEPDEDDKGGKVPLMVPANRHAPGALVKMAGSDKTQQVHAVHPDGSYDIHELHNPGKEQKQVPHDNLTLLAEQEAREELAKLAERLTPAQDEKPGQQTKEEQMAENEAVKLAEKTAADAVAKLAEADAKVKALEAAQRDGRIAAFCETHKEYIIPALRPAFEAVAKAEGGMVKLAEKELSFMDAFLAFAEEFIKAKKVVTGETAPEGQSVTDAAAEVKLAEAQYKDTQSAKSGCDVKDAALLVEARAYAEGHKVPFRAALLAVAKLHNIEEGGK